MRPCDGPTRRPLRERRPPPKQRVRIGQALLESGTGGYIFYIPPSPDLHTEQDEEFECELTFTEMKNPS